MTEPVATLPACLCGLDTNPVASPRMDIHCPKHDVPEAGGEPELRTRMTKLNRPAYERLVSEDLEWLLKQPRTLERDHVEVIVRQSPDREYRVSQPAGSFRFLTRDDAERFIKHYLHSAQWEGERLIISFEREGLIEALVEGDALAEARRAQGTPTTDTRERAVKALQSLRRWLHTTNRDGVGFTVWPERVAEIDTIASALSSTPRGAGNCKHGIPICRDCQITEVLAHVEEKQQIRSTPSEQKEKEDV